MGTNMVVTHCDLRFGCRSEALVSEVSLYIKTADLTLGLLKARGLVG